MIDFTSIVNNVVVVAVTWLLHSTILLSSVWLSVRLFLPRSWGFRERLWRCAAVLSFVTVALQLSLTGTRPVIT